MLCEVINIAKLVRIIIKLGLVKFVGKQVMEMVSLTHSRG